MSKATREIKEKIDLVDLLIELVDARCPISSRNPVVSELKSKKRIIVMTKIDLADKEITKEWKEYFKKQDIICLDMNLNGKVDIKEIVRWANEAMKEKLERDARRGIKNRPIRAMVVGIPNVGKSTFINKVIGRKAASVANKPGQTKSQQWVKNGNVELLDTPGILWPKFEDKEVGVRLALIGSIKDNILNQDKLADILLEFLATNYKSSLEARYNIVVDKEIDIEYINDLFANIAKNRGLLISGGEADIDRAKELVLKEFRDGKIVNASLERCDIDGWIRV
jgi:ribosome biogenesis GTPase A